MVRIKRDFTKIYDSEVDPWNIGLADSERYIYYKEKLLQLVDIFEVDKRNILDIGCGKAAFLNHFDQDFNELFGIDISEKAIDFAKSRIPNGKFAVASADALNNNIFENIYFDVIILSDVVYYLKPSKQVELLNWVHKRLNNNGILLAGSWTPGKKYFSKHEFLDLFSEKFNLIFSKYFNASKHSLLFFMKRNKFVAFTLDYETWQPIPEGKCINIQDDIVKPSNQWIEFGNQLKVPITFFVETCEIGFFEKYFYPDFLEIKNQLIKINNSIHDIQLHLHPSWSLNLGAKLENNNFSWNTRLQSLSDLDSDIADFVENEIKYLHELINDINFRISCFRAGGYSIQPSRPIYQALVKNNIFFDSSVYKNGVSIERKHNFTNSFHPYNPWKVDPFDFKNYGIYTNSKITEIPVAVLKSERLMLDNDAATKIVEQLKKIIKANRFHPGSFLYRISYLFKNNLTINRISKKFLIKKETYDYMLNDYFVAIGHTKAKHDFKVLKNLVEWCIKMDFRFLTMSDMNNYYIQEQLVYNKIVKFEIGNVLYKYINNNECNLKGLIPLSNKILFYKYDDLESIDEIFFVHNKSEIWLNLDNRERDRLSSKEKNRYDYKFFNSENNSESFDFIIIDKFDGINVSSDDLNKIIGNLNKNGLICFSFHFINFNSAINVIKGLNLDILNIIESNIHTLEGNKDFNLVYCVSKLCDSNIIDVIDSLAVNIYNNISPEKNNKSQNPLDIIKSGYAWCGGYALVFNYYLKILGINSKIVDFNMYNHPRGRGIENIDSHVINSVIIDENEFVYDIMSCLRYQNSLFEIIENPILADNYINLKINHDIRFHERGYKFYIGEFAFSRFISFNN